METDSVDYPDLLQVCGSGNHNISTPKGRKHPFLQRSDSTLCLGCPPLDPFDTVMSEALPLADQPHLLQPHSRRDNQLVLMQVDLVRTLWKVCQQD